MQEIPDKIKINKNPGGIRMEFVTLNNGVKMPLEGFGVFQVPDPEQCEQAALRWNI